MRILLCVLFAGLLSHPLAAQTQTHVDSLFALAHAMPDDSFKVKRINEIAASIARSQVSQAFDYAEAALTLSEAIDFPAGAAKAYYTLAVVSLQTGQQEDALANYIAALRLCNQHGLKPQKGEVLRGLGNYFREIGDWETSESYTRQSIGIARELGDSLAVAKGLNNLSTLQRDDIHFKYILQSAEIMENLVQAGKVDPKDLNFLFIIYYNISNQYFELKKFNKSIEYSNKAIEVNNKNDNAFNNVLAYSQIARIYDADGKYAEALKAAQKALEISNSSGNRSVIAAGLQSLLCSIYRHQQNHTEALKHAGTACELFRNLDNTVELIKVMYYIAEIYFDKKDYRSSLLKANETLTLAETHEDMLTVAKCELLVGKILVAQKKDAEALPRFLHCTAIVAQQEFPVEEYVSVYRELASLYTRMQQPATAAEMQQRYNELTGAAH